MTDEKYYALTKAIRDALRLNLDRAQECTNRALVSEDREISTRYLSLAEGMLEANRNILQTLIEVGEW